MRKKSFKLHTLACVALTVAMTGCTDLKEQVIDEVLGSNNSNPENALAAAYGQLGDGTFVDHGNVFALQEYSTDEALLPTRGSDWGDGGVWRAIHEFTWAPDNSVVTNTWNALNAGITKSLTAISAINAKPDFTNKKLFLAEAKGLLDFYTFHTLDLYGQAPYRDPADVNAPITVRKAAEGIDELIKDVEAILPDLANIGEQNTHNGRFTKQAAFALLSDMYLNRAVFKDRYASSFKFDEPAVSGTGTDMDKVIEYSTLLIHDPTLLLRKNYFENFDINNSGGAELIFVVTQQINTLRNSDNDFAYMSMERNQKPSPANRGTNASCITPEFYKTWENNHDDPRFSRHYQYADGTWFMNDGTDVSVPATSIVPNSASLPWFHFNRGLQVGQQYGPKLLPNGTFEMTDNGRIKVSKLTCEKNTSLPMDFTPELKFDNPVQSVFTQAQINQGVRVFKYEFDPERDNSSSNVDIPLYRLGGIYCMRAEAYFRKNQFDLSLADLNKLRTTRTRESLYGSVPGKELITVNDLILYNETGYEMYWEMYRRKAAIRFNRFDSPCTAKPASQPYRRIYPIPQSTMDATKIYTQNDKY
ncbi:RagB/SusD family nutrient uptake outer membrane protein [Chitinophaga pinensis]|uniref:RagB/SusD family nutrient uptake outer membrane protein n=1 Tax=Chitinophaga pinensis TaxID=79329 RepID=A0A5C6LPC2_9BACT|nr:RagB/SusD family nutrient uptake outer membrane protein [Chitinophaga pinensis]TWV93324.1 RagB/SusD family nutrient uptake outer membrane protein [Chitinophaga pinensis]